MFSNNIKLFSFCLIFLLCAFFAIALMAESPDLAGYWKFNDNTLDYSGNDSNGEITGVETYGSGKFGKAFDFNGNTVIECSQNSNLCITDNISVETWIYPETWFSGYASHIIAKWNGSVSDANYVMYFFGSTSGGDYKKIRFYANASGTWKAVSPDYLVPSLDTWYHVVWTYNSTIGGRLYINGTEQGTATGSGTLATNTANLEIGNDFDGMCDEVKVYNRVLSDSEIALKYQDSQTKGYWNFHNNTIDFSGNDNSGTVSGTASYDSGNVGRAFDFNGSTYIDCGSDSSLSITDNISVETWFYPEAYPTSNASYVINKWTSTSDANYVMYFFGSSSGNYKKVAFYANAGGTWKVVSPFYLIDSLNSWYHIVWTYNSSTGGKLYINGLEQGTATGSGALATTTANLEIGNGFTGMLDEVYVYNRVLSSSEISDNYQDVGTGGFTLENDTLKLTVNSAGKITELKGDNRELTGGQVDFLKMSRPGEWLDLVSCFQKNGRLIFDFYGDLNNDIIYVTAEITAKTCGDYLIFQLYSLYGDTDEISEVRFFNLEPPLNTYVDNISGIRGDNSFTLALRGMNAKSDIYSGLTSILAGSSYAYSGFELAKFGLLGSPASTVRSALQTMLESESLTMSRSGGPWALDVSGNKSSYIFAFDMSPSNVDSYIDMAKDAGSEIINFYYWWTSFGHYVPDSTYFPNGLSDMKACVDAIHAEGLKASVHCLSGLISLDDSYVTGSPDSRLFKDVQFTLSSSINTGDTTIYVNEQPPSSTLGTGGGYLQIGNEIISYTGYTQTSPYQFTGCVRGVCGTTIQSHTSGDDVCHFRFVYGCFYPDPSSTLVNEIADNIANVVNYCGFDMIYLDGAEGIGNSYSMFKMGTAIINRIENPIRVETSNPIHLYWPFVSNLGAWDYPRYGIKKFIDRHVSMGKDPLDTFIPCQLGWWSFIGFDVNHYSQLPDEVEYLCAKSLGCDAALSLHLLLSPDNGRRDEYLEIIKAYETLRASGNVSESVKSQLRTADSEFHLTSSNNIIARDNLAQKIIIDTASESDLAGHWPFNENILDSSANDNDGTVYGSTAWADGQDGKAFDFNGSTYIDCGSDSSMSITDNISVEMWIYPEAWVSGYASHIISKWTSTSDANYVMYFFGSTSGDAYKKIRFYANAGGTWKAVSPSYLVPSLNTWYHVLWTYNSTKGGRLFINGTEQGTATGSGTLATSTANLEIGNSFNGLLDEVKISSATPGTSTWSVTNRFNSQSAKFRIQALHSTYMNSYDGTNIVLDDFQDAGNFLLTNADTQITSSLSVNGGVCTYTANNNTSTSVGAWTRASKTFSPGINIAGVNIQGVWVPGAYDTLGIWINGDGKGEILNFQLVSSGSGAYDDHYVVVNFTGWKYFELYLRERDADKFEDYSWPYNSTYGVYRNTLLRDNITNLNIYYNNLPVGQQVSCQIKPVKALYTESIEISNPSISISGSQISFPVILTSGQYVEFYSMSDCKLYNANGSFNSNITPTGSVPTLGAGSNDVTFTGTGTPLYDLRTNVTMFIDGSQIY